MEKRRIIYSLVHERIKDRQKPNSFIWRKELFTILGRIYHIPKCNRHEVMDELIEMGYMKWNKRDYLEIL